MLVARGGAQRSQARQSADEARVADDLRRRRRRRIRTVGIVALVFSAAAVLIALDPAPPGVAVPTLAPSHIATADEPHVAYTTRPPSSGPHTGGMPQVGLIADEPIAAEDYLHFMEDAGIGLFFDCPIGCDDLVDGLAGFVDANRDERLFVAPYDGIVDDAGVSRPMAAVAWGRILYIDDLDQTSIDELEVFVSLYEGIDHHAG